MLSIDLPNNEAHVYFARLSELPFSVNDLTLLLDETERARATRFVRTVLQDRYTLTHGLLRLVLAKYLAIAPNEVTFTVNEHNKPLLAPAHASTLQFNLSHSEDAVVIAITKGIAVGVDIEVMTATANMDVAERFFNPPEFNALTPYSGVDQAKMFYRIWAKKEAVVKADSQGFALLHANFSVSLSAAPEIIPLAQNEWSLYTLDLLPEYASALATSQPVNIRIQSMTCGIS